MPDQDYIWICGWVKFQHYVPKRDQAAPWVKASTRQVLENDYRRLPVATRLLLHELRTAFALTRHRLTRDTKHLSHLLAHRVFTQQLEALNHAGFIEFVSRELLERRLDLLYNGSRAEVELEVETDHSLRGVNLELNGSAPPPSDADIPWEILYPTANLEETA